MNVWMDYSDQNFVKQTSIMDFVWDHFAKRYLNEALIHSLEEVLIKYYY